MNLEEYPDEVDIVETNFKTDQQSDAAEKIAEEWPVDLDRLAEEGQHVKMFYKQVLEQFLGPAEAGATFAEIKDEHGSLEQWAGNGSTAEESDDGDEEAAVEAPDIDDIEPGLTDDQAQNGTDTGGSVLEEARTPSSGAAAQAIDEGGAAAEGPGEQQRAWFRAGFREGIEFAKENPELFFGE